MKKADSKDGLTPSQLITNQIAELADWRGQLKDLIRVAIALNATGAKKK